MYILNFFYRQVISSRLRLERFKIESNLLFWWCFYNPSTFGGSRIVSREIWSFNSSISVKHSSTSRNWFLYPPRKVIFFCNSIFEAIAVYYRWIVEGKAWECETVVGCESHHRRIWSGRENMTYRFIPALFNNHWRRWCRSIVNLKSKN